MAVYTCDYKRYLKSTNVVIVEPGVHEKLKNAAAVNEALRTLILRLTLYGIAV